MVRNRVLLMFLVRIKGVMIMGRLEMKMWLVMELIKQKMELFTNIFAEHALKNFTSRANTISHELRTDEKTVFLALKMILKGMSLRSTADMLNVKLDTVRRWLQISSKHCEEVNQVLMKDIDVDKVELDELWTFVKKKMYLSMDCQSEK
ncbi:MAG: helix-turn-helix domain-containing protein [Methanobrevibacter sp.]|nr:helix-turn-helix domain-containing protein [Candidatus Methanovirga procula]